MSYPRRSRFTVTACRPDSDRIEKFVVLAYAETGARSFYTARDYTVLDVKRGDHRKQARVAEAHARGGFTIDPAALRDACDLLGLALPVRVRMSGRHGAQQGNYQFGGDHHKIMLKSYHTPEQASATLWHELTHAMQAERVTHDGLSGRVLAWSASVRAEHATHSYRLRPSEVEAREMSATMSDVSLCR